MASSGLHPVLLRIADILQELKELPVRRQRSGQLVVWKQNPR